MTVAPADGSNFGGVAPDEGEGAVAASRDGAAPAAADDGEEEEEEAATPGGGRCCLALAALFARALAMATSRRCDSVEKYAAQNHDSDIWGRERGQTKNTAARGME